MPRVFISDKLESTGLDLLTRAGLELKEHLSSWLVDHGHEPVDHGPFVASAESVVIRPKPEGG